jgi:hypothetical protein
MVNGKVQNSGNATDEVDGSPPGLGIHRKEWKQRAFNSNIGDILIVFSVRFTKVNG